jgi:hypothetical protein
MTKCILDGRRAQDRLSTSGKSIKSEKRIILSQPNSKKGALGESSARPRMAFSTRNIMVDDCVRRLEPVTDRR